MKNIKNSIKYSLLLLLCSAGVANAFGFFGVFAPPIRPRPFVPVCVPVREEVVWYDDYDDYDNYDNYEDEYEGRVYVAPVVRPAYRVARSMYYGPRAFVPRPHIGFGIGTPGFSFHVGF